MAIPVRSAIAGSTIALGGLALYGTSKQRPSDNGPDDHHLIISRDEVRSALVGARGSRVEVIGSGASDAAVGGGGGFVPVPGSDDITNAPVYSSERDRRLAALVPYDPSPSTHVQTEGGILASIAERDVQPLTGPGRYAAVVSGLRDINNELDFWGPDCMVPFAAATGVQLRPDGSVDVAKSMRAIDSNHDNRLSRSEIDAFDASYDETKWAAGKPIAGTTPDEPLLGRDVGSVSSND